MVDDATGLAGCAGEIQHAKRMMAMRDVAHAMGGFTFARFMP
jgi:hypothetical protein